MTDQTNVPMSPPPPAPASQQSSGGGNRTLIIVLVILLVLCCCCSCIAFGAYAWQNGDQWFNTGRTLLPLLAAL